MVVIGVVVVVVLVVEEVVVLVVLVVIVNGGWLDPSCSETSVQCCHLLSLCCNAGMSECFI